MYNLGTFSHWIHPWNIAELIYINCVYMYNAWYKKLNKCQLIKTHLLNRCMCVIEPTEEGLQHGRICSVCQKLHHIQKERATVSTEGLLHQVSVWGRVRISLLFCLCCGPLLSPIKMEVLCWHIMIQWNLFTVKLPRTNIDARVIWFSFRTYK